MSGLAEIRKKLEAFKRQYYFRQVMLGILIFLIVNSIVLLIVSSLEHQFWLGITGRSILFFSFLILIFASSYSLIVRPALTLAKIKKGITDEEAAKVVSQHFPEIEDRLLNTLQLGKQSSNELIIAAIEKKSLNFNHFAFIQAVDFKPIKKYGAILFSIAVVFSLVSFINPSLLTEGSKRIVYFKTEFIPEAPFSFEIINEDLKAFRGEDFTLNVKVSGNQLPESIKMLVEGSAPKKTKLAQSGFSFTFSKIQTNKNIQFEAAGFISKTYRIEVNDRPDLVSMLIQISEPAYTGGQKRTIENTGNLTLLEGSSVIWNIYTLATDSAHFILNENKSKISRSAESNFLIDQRITSDGSYRIDLFNEFSKNKSELSYTIDLIKDKYPEIIAQYFPDSITYQEITFAGSISDDYGFSGLNINYRKSNKQDFTKIALDINREVRSQSYFASWNLDTLKLNPGQSLEVYMSVVDNDGVHGPKETNASSFILRSPTNDEIDAIISEKNENVEDQLGATEKKAEEIANRLEEIEERLKSEQKFNWQEKKLLNDVIEDREKLSEEIEKLKKQHEELLKSNKRFQNQSSKQEEKNQQLQELLNELMDEETMKLYEKLKELMKEKNPSDQIRQEISEIKKSEENLERDLERALELFKRLKMESALEQNLQKLDTLSQKQENAAANPNDKETQENIKEEFDQFRDEMNEVQKLNQELKRPEAMEDFELEERQIAKELREITEQMQQEENEGNDSGEKSEKSEDQQQGEESEKQDSEQQQQGQSQTQQNKSKSLQQKQKNAAQKMKSLSKKLSKMQGGMQMEMMQANLDQLRDILDNLVKLSFNQEEIMLEMRKVNQSDPRFLELSQNQLKLKDDAKVIQDSLLSLASKVVQISSFVTREVGLINENIDESIDYLKDRNRVRALSSQQFAMTSINNLALLLDDTMQQMQMSMSEAMGNSSSGEKKQPQGMPDMQELQNKLGEKINELKGSGKSGRELSEELARLAAGQEMIRRQMERLKEAQDGKPGGGLGGDDMKRAIDMMKQNEIDLVNKKLTQQLINRQKQIMTRMLEAEKAQRDQEMDEERKAEKPRIITQEMPPAFEKYLELKKKEIELLKSIPLELNPFYKKEVNDYFRRLSSDEEND